MKKIVLSIFFTFILFSLFAQSNYDEAIQQGDNALKRDEYTTAIKKYLIAETFDQTKWKIIQEKLDVVYAVINEKQKELKKTVTELNETIKQLNFVTAEKKELDNKLSSTKTEIEQIKQKMDNLGTLMQNVLKTMDSIIIQTNELENKLSPAQNTNKQ